MRPETVVPLVFAVPLLAAVLLVAVGRWLPRWVVDAVATVTAAAVAGIACVLLVGSGDRRLVVWVGGWVPHHGESVGVVLAVDQLGAGVALLAALLVVAALVYTWRYYASVEATFHALLLVFLGGVCGFAVSGDLFDMFVFFELTGAVSYVLTGYRIEDPDTVQGAFHFGIVNSVGAYFGLLGIVLLYGRTGELGLARIGAALPGHSADALVLASFVLLVTGMLVKAAAVPFHFWTADAEGVAPSPVCMLFSGVLVETGVYGVARIYWAVFSGTLPAADVGRMLLAVGAVTAVVGGTMCLYQRNLKRLLAYATICHVGLFLLGVGTMTRAGVAAAALYVVAHAGVQGALFLACGILLNRHGSADVGELHGALRGRARSTAGVFVAGVLGLAGVPPFGTFLGKSALDDTLLAGGHTWAVVVTVLATSLTAAAVLAATLRVFTGTGRPLDGGRRAGEETEESGRRITGVPWTMTLPALCLLAGTVASGWLPRVATTAATGAAQLTDRTALTIETLTGAAAGTPASPAPTATATGLALTAATATLTAAWTLALLHGHRLTPTIPSPLRRVLTTPQHLLTKAHTEHLGDSITWLTAGAVALTALLLA